VPERERGTAPATQWRSENNNRKGMRKGRRGIRRERREQVEAMLMS
jgi:hypothetical protein